MRKIINILLLCFFVLCLTQNVFANDINNSNPIKESNSVQEFDESLKQSNNIQQPLEELKNSKYKNITKNSIEKKEDYEPALYLKNEYVKKDDSIIITGKLSERYGTHKKVNVHEYCYTLDNIIQYHTSYQVETNDNGTFEIIKKDITPKKYGIYVTYNEPFLPMLHLLYYNEYYIKTNTNIIINNITYENLNEIEIKGKFIDEYGNGLQTMSKYPIIAKDTENGMILNEFHTNNNGTFKTKFQLRSTQNNNQYSDSNFDIRLQTNETKYYFSSNTIISIENKKDDKLAYIGEKSNLTFDIQKLENKSINKGFCIFKINGLTLKDKYNCTIKKNVENGKVSLEYIIPPYYKQRQYLLEIIYTDNSNEFISFRNIVLLNVLNRKFELKIKYKELINQVRVYEFIPTLFKDKIQVYDGFIIFKINGITLKDNNNNTLKYYLKNNNNNNQLIYQIPLHWSAKKVKLTVVYNKGNYGRIENSTYFKLNKTNIHMNIETESYIHKLHIKGSIKDLNNENVKGSNIIGLKINGKTVKNLFKFMVKINGQFLQTKFGELINYFTINEGKIDIEIQLLEPLNDDYNLTITTGERSAYYGYRMTTLVKYS